MYREMGGTGRGERVQEWVREGRGRGIRGGRRRGWSSPLYTIH